MAEHQPSKLRAEGSSPSECKSSLLNGEYNLIGRVSNCGFESMGSIPVICRKYKKIKTHSSEVELWTFNPRALGSNPSASNIT